MTAAGIATAEPLAGFTVAVTADPRHDELATLLERYGARVVVTPVLRIVAFPDDTELRAATTACVERPPDLLVVTADLGLRGWLAAAHRWGLARSLRVRLAGAHLVARVPKSHGAARTAGLVDDWAVTRKTRPSGASASSGATAAPLPESSDEVLDYLLDRGVAGLRIAVQVHGEPQPEFCTALRAAGAEVTEVPVYRWGPPVDPGPLRRLVNLVSGRLVDAVTFTSAPAVCSLLDAGGQPVLDQLRDNVAAACVGPVAAAPLVSQGVPVIAPDRTGIGALVRALVDELPRRAPTLKIAGMLVTLCGHAVVVNEMLKPLAPGPMAVLRALAEANGEVMSRAELLQVLPQGADEHVVQMAIARLRTALGDSRFVQTVAKRGYRLAVD